MPDAYQVIQKDTLQIAVLSVLLGIADMDEVYIQRQVRHIAALGKLIRCSLAHQFIALLFGEWFDIGYRFLVITVFFYNDFFGNGMYVNYTSIVPSSKSQMKSGKNYKTTATVQVMKDLLRKDLENAKVLKSLITGF